MLLGIVEEKDFIVRMSDSVASEGSRLNPALSGERREESKRGRRG